MNFDAWGDIFYTALARPLMRIGAMLPYALFFVIVIAVISISIFNSDS